MARQRQRAPLFFSVQTRSAQADGVLGFAFFSPYQTPRGPILGTGTWTGDYVQEGGRQHVQQQNGVLMGYGGLFSGVTAAQNLVDADYLKSLADGP